MNREQPVAVTGAAGFIGSEIVRQLLAAGRRVRGSVRTLDDPSRYDFLTALPGAAERLELVAAKLGQEDAFARAFVGCGAVIHTASPYIVNPDDPKRDLLDPAVEGTTGVLRAAARTPSVCRVVITSSMAAISDEPRTGHVFTEGDWNTASTLTRNPYHFSKAEAERAAWSFVGPHAPDGESLGFDVVVMNPFMVVGPSISPALNTSNQVIRDIIVGSFPGLIALSWGFVDVRDVAQAHIEALSRPAASGRYLLAAESWTMNRVVDLLRASGCADGYRLPRLDLSGQLATALIRVAALTRPRGTRGFLRTHLGKVMEFDNSKALSELGISFRPVGETLLATVADLIRWGHLEQRVR